MSDTVLMDNDIILKTCCYNAIDELLCCMGGTTRTANVLGVARYVLAGVIARGRYIRDKAQVSRRLMHFLGQVNEIEPNDGEVELAAQLEESAQLCGLNLDSGESQLLAVLIQRSARVLVTGDKRAIRSMESVVRRRGYDGQVGHRIACFEQIMMTLLGRYGAEKIHSRVCSEPGADITMAICFKCDSKEYTLESISRALKSYIMDLRRDASSVLLDSDDLSRVISQEDGVG